MLQNPKYYKEKIEGDSTKRVEESKKRVNALLRRIHDRLNDLKEWNLPITLEFGYPREDEEFYREDLPFLRNALHETEWKMVSDPTFYIDKEANGFGQAVGISVLTITNA